MDFSYVCNDCGQEIRSDEIVYRCPKCGGSEGEGEMRRGNLRVEIDPEVLQSLAKKERIHPNDFMPFPIPQVETYPVGNTPLIGPARLRKKTACPRLYLKNDGMNPSGSFKDRASQLVAAQALHYGVSTVALASTGNAGSAMACAGAAYGLEIVLFVPHTAPENKLLQSVLYGAKVVPIADTYDAAFGLSLEYSRIHGGINRNTGYNPMTTEGKKSISIELWNDLGRQAPDVVYVPVGDGVIYSGVYKGFYDLKAAGLIDRIPKLIAVQSTASNAIAQAWKKGELRTIPRATTKADSISVASPANGRMAVKYLKDSGSWATEVEDAAILAAQLELASEAGTFVEPAAAAAYAGFQADLASGKVNKDQHIVILLTGIGFKDMKAVSGSVSIPEAVEPTMEAVERFLG
ncbi:MAG TPA: pyridoxal-phosphate dependent enzyme [Sediminispirochaeta sp.]|nr:pyridoxal-phosphate dependent enzyme [Sediminispirochaeta sp.]